MTTNMNKRVEEIYNAYKANKRGVKKLIVEFFTEELKGIYWRNMQQQCYKVTYT